MNDLKLKEPSYLHRVEWRVDGEGVAGWPMNGDDNDGDEDD